jgi:uncharacterized short protein YbdD (DUF466 family)
MTDRRTEQFAAAREERFLAMLRAGQAPGQATGLFDPLSSAQRDTLRVVAPCQATEAGQARPTHIGWLVPNALWRLLWRAWCLTRELSGDDAYERYLEHVKRVHPDQVPMTRAEHYAFRQDQKWSRLSRCC